MKKKKYWFKTDTLVKLINAALINSDNISDINSIKPYNPYNRKEFNLYEINKIYKYLSEKNKLPILLHLYKNSNYNIDDFKFVNNTFLYDYIIQNINDENKEIIMEYFEQMCGFYNINFNNFNFIKENFDKYHIKLRELVRINNHTKFRNKPVKKLIILFLDDINKDFLDSIEDENKSELLDYRSQVFINLIDEGNVQRLGLNQDEHLNNLSWILDPIQSLVPIPPYEPI